MKVICSSYIRLTGTVFCRQIFFCYMHLATIVVAFIFPFAIYQQAPCGMDAMTFVCVFFLESVSS